jgi:lipopolysaccharide/colanic/teichoic acid biosynthesis glycosyltransferase
MVALRLFVIGFLSGLLGFVLSPHYHFIPADLSSFNDVIKASIVFGICLGVASLINGHNDRMWAGSKVDFIVNVFASSIVGAAISLFLIYILSFEFVGRWVLFLSVVMYVMFSCVASVVSCLLGGVKIAVIGYDLAPFFSAIDDLKLKKIERLFIPAKISSDAGESNKIVSGIRDRRKVYFLVSSSLQVQSIISIIDPCRAPLCQFYSIDYFLESQFGVSRLDQIDSEHWWDVPTRLRESSFALFKRCVDILVVLMLAVPSVVVIVLCSLIIKISDGGTVFYRQTRLGQYGKPFSIIKIRTMRLDSEASGAKWAQQGDSRVTSVGRILRKTRMDELPQLWNILRGDMSIIGPRPERPEFYELIGKEVAQFKLRLVAKPGLTGWAQVNYPYGASINDSKNKMRYDLYYILNASVIIEMRIISRTILAMVRGAR